MALGLAMPLLALGLPLSLSGAPANLLAVPWIELLVVPPALAGSLLLWVPGLGEGLLRAAGVSLDLLFRALGLLAGLASSLEATCRRQAERLGVPLTYAMVKVSAKILPETEQPASLNCRIDVESGISNSVLERLAALVRKHCTILGMLDGNTKIDIEFRPLAI